MTETREWWQDFFQGPWGDLQARGYPPEKTRAEVDFITSALSLDGEEKVLDVPCGIGRHTVELAVRGFDVVGLDFNGSALELARKAAADSEVSPQFVEQDMRALDWDQEFDAAFSFFSSFGYFEDETDNLDVARGVARALRPGGRFLIDTHVTETVFPVFQSRHWGWFDESHSGRLLEEAQWSIATGRCDSEWTFVEENGIRTSRSSLRIYSYRELCELLRAAGFSDFQGLQTLSDEPFELGARRLSLVARK